jgi:hypothetical protein
MHINGTDLELLEDNLNSLTKLQREVEVKNMKLELKKKKEVDMEKLYGRDDYSLPIIPGDFFLSLHGFMRVIEGLFIACKELSSNNSVPVSHMLKSLNSSSHLFSQVTSKKSFYFKSLKNSPEQGKSSSSDGSQNLVPEILPISFLMWLISRFLFRIYDWDQDEKITGSDLYSVLTTLQPDIVEDDLMIISFHKILYYII